jgi:cation diffusion facilitator family transporter
VNESVAPVEPAGEEVVSLYRIMRVALWTEIPVSVLLIVVGTLSGSSAVLVMTLQAVVDICVQLFELYAIRQTIRRDVEAFPYGAGKLENFGAFLWAVLTIPAAVFVLVTSGLKLWQPDAVAYGLSTLAIAVSATRLVLLWVFTARLRRRLKTPSPVLVSFLADTKIDTLSSLGVLLSFAIAVGLLAAGLPALGDRVDPGVALLIGAYQLAVGVTILRGNFRSLMDLPLSVVDQLTVMRVLADHHRDFEHIGMVSTRSHGNEKYVEVELAFADDTPVPEIARLSQRIEASLGHWIDELRFRLAPVTRIEHDPLDAVGDDE